MEQQDKPIIYVSKCLGFDYCRYNGLIISSEFVQALHGHVNFALVCPEVEIGLGVPRHPIRVVSHEGRLKLIQSITEKDITGDINRFARELFDLIADVDGFILKSKSPSCGIKDVKVYPGLGKVPVMGKDSGFFGGEVVRQYTHLAIEDEARLTNFRIREHFLSRVFTFARFRKVKRDGTMGRLVEFQSLHKYLLMAYSQKELRLLGRIVANHERKPVAEVYADYENHLYSALARMPRLTSNINALTHVMGHFSKVIKPEEKRFLLDSMHRYREGRIPLSVPLNLLRSYAIRFENEYVKNQAFFEPYPIELELISDSGKGRKTS